jgi:hypothetical protein
MSCPNYNPIHIDIKLPLDIDVDILKRYITNLFKVKLSLVFGDPQPFINIIGDDKQQVNSAARAVMQFIIDTLLINVNNQNIKLDPLLLPNYIK